jgi:ABC-type phosphate transport system substrate-binding protein
VIEMSAKVAQTPPAIGAVAIATASAAVAAIIIVRIESLLRICHCP